MHQRLVKLGLESFESRLADLLFMYKLIVWYIIDLKLSDFFIPNFHSRHHRYQLYLPCTNL